MENIIKELEILLNNDYDLQIIKSNIRKELAYNLKNWYNYNYLHVNKNNTVYTDNNNYIQNDEFFVLKLTILLLERFVDWEDIDIILHDFTDNLENEIIDIVEKYNISNIMY